MLDPRKLRPGELAQLLNSTSLGAVVDTRDVSKLRVAGGLKIVAADDPKRIDLLKLVAWMAVRRHAAASPGAGGADDEAAQYALLKERARHRSRELSMAGRDIGQVPIVHDAARKAACRKSLRLFCETYFPRTFRLGWSDDHLRVITKIETAVLQGGLFAMAMPRGSGKTSLCEIACLWALLYGHRLFVALIGADEGHAMTMLESIKIEVETNELLLEDFPEVCFPVRAMDGIHQRAAGQICGGKPTYIVWGRSEIVMPSIAGSPASGAALRVAGITGQIRGMKHKRPDGTAVRPELVLIDDPQTDESARSLTQSAAREAIINGAILGLAGPGKKIAGLMTLTVVQREDLADRVLDRSKHPEWKAERTKMVYSFPTRNDLWEKYAKIRAEGFRGERAGTDANEFYAKHRAQMDRGARVAWEQRFDQDELSAIQSAMNLKLRDEASFFAEYQNEPIAAAADSGLDQISPTAVARRTNGIARGLIPHGASILTASIDVQQKALFWVLTAWADDFTGWVVDYGTEPEQPTPYFTLRDLKRTMQTVYPKMGLEGTINAALGGLVERLCGKEWGTDGGGSLRIDRALIDANWEQSRDVVYNFCRGHARGAMLTPSHGRYVGASTRSFAEYTKKRGDRIGMNWRVPAVAGKHPVRKVQFDTNFWKSFVAARLTTAIGDPGALSLYGSSAERHKLFSEHMGAEAWVRTEARGRTVDEWKIRTIGRDNHWFDGIVGCAVAASMSGITLPGMEAASAFRKKRTAQSFAAMQAAARFGY